MTVLLTILLIANVLAIIFAGLRANAKHTAEKKYWAGRDLYPMPSGSMRDQSSAS